MYFKKYDCLRKLRSWFYWNLNQLGVNPCPIFTRSSWFPRLIYSVDFVLFGQNNSVLKEFIFAYLLFRNLSSFQIRKRELFCVWKPGNCSFISILLILFFVCVFVTLKWQSYFFSLVPLQFVLADLGLWFPDWTSVCTYTRHQIYFIVFMVPLNLNKLN